MIQTYLPSVVNVASGSNTTFDGSASSTNEALIVGAAGSFDAEIYYEAYDGTAWQTVAQLEQDDGTLTFNADWHSQGNRFIVSSNDRRLRIENVDSSSGYIAVDGDEL